MIVAFTGVVGLVLWLSHRVAFQAPFYLDSVWHLVDKTNLHLSRLSPPGLLDAMRADYGQGLDRPLSRLTLAFTYYFAGLNPVAFRIGNLLIHVLATLGFVFVAASILQTPRVRATPARDGASPLPVALLAAALWSLHPVQTNVTTYVIQRMASLAGLFEFLSLGCYLRGRMSSSGWSWRWAAASFIAFVLAVASKENGVVLLPLLAAAEGLFFDRSRRRDVWRGLTIFFGVLCLILVLLALWRGIAPVSQMAGLLDRVGLTYGQYLLTEIQLQGRYLLVLLIPDHRLLSIDAEVIPCRDILHPPSALAMLLALLLALIIAWRQASRAPLISFTILWYLGAQMVEASLLPQDLYFEHRLYFPSAALFLMAAVGLGALTQVGLRRRWAIYALIVFFLGVESYNTYLRNRVWANPIRFWTDVVAKAPSKTRPKITLAVLLMDVGALDDARQLLLQALGTHHLDDLSLYNLGVLETRAGHKEASQRYFDLLFARKSPLAWKGHRFLAANQITAGDLRSAEDHTHAALELQPSDSALWDLLGAIYARRGDTIRAAEAFQKSLALDPGDEAVRRRLAEVLRILRTPLSAQSKRERIAPSPGTPSTSGPGS